MHPFDWVVIAAIVGWVLYDGLKRTHHSRELEGYFLAKRSIPWWAAGLSVMATQLSAITMIGTTGQAYSDGLRFIQFYFALPIAMIVLSVTLVPFFYRSGVYTAYEYLERRFDAKTRALTSFLFLLSRSMSCAVVISAPAVVLSLVLGWSLTATALVIAVPAILYTMFGGVQAVTWTDVKVMVLTVIALGVLIVVAVAGWPAGVGLGDGLSLAAAAGRLRTFDFSLTLTNQYTFWSGTIAAFFLFCSYFGADQSQVQRYLTARSVDGARHSLLMSAYWKIPLQFIVLLVGVLVFIFYTFHQPPLVFSRVHVDRLEAGPNAADYAALQQDYDAAFAARREAASAFAAARAGGDAAAIAAGTVAFETQNGLVQEIRTRATALVRQNDADGRFSDVNYIIPTFILTQLPIGLVGLLLVVIFLTATDTIAGELNSLSTATIIDFYKRWFRPVGTDRHYLLVSKLVTGLWGLFACAIAVWAAELGSLIEVVNRFGSFFYGSILGVFILAIGVRRATGTGAFIGLIAGMSAVASVFWFTNVAFLWHNVVGAGTVVFVGWLASLAGRQAGSRPAGT
jgi:SSS family transporter